MKFELEQTNWNEKSEYVIEPSKYLKYLEKNALLLV